MEEPFIHKVFIGQRNRVSNVLETDSMKNYQDISRHKRVVEEKIWLGKNGLDGDETSDKNGSHDRAAFAYPIKHYTYWKENFNYESIDLGMIGENFAVLEMDEFTVCVGDQYQFGDAIIQVSEPRLPSWHLSRLVQIEDFALHVQNSGRTGWYFRVLREGYVISRIDLELIDRPYPEWTIAACNEVMHFNKHDLRLTDQLLSCSLLSQHWKNRLQKRLRGQEPSDQKRLFG